MQGKKARIIIAILSIAALLAACGGPAGGGGATTAEAATTAAATTTAAAATTTTAKAEETTAAAAASTDKRPLVKHFLNQAWATQEYWGKDDISKAIMDKLNIDVELSKPTADDNQQLTLMLASGDLPDVITCDLDSTLRFMVEKSGLVLQPRPIIEKVAPEFIPYIGEQYFEIIKADDGKNYCLAACIFTDKIFENDLYAPVGPWNPAQLAREDLWIEFGKPDISTPDGLMNALLECKAKYPNIVPFNFNRSLMTTGINNGPYGMGWIISGFGAQNYFTNSEGKVTAAWNNPKWLEGVKFISKMYRNGIIDDEMIAQDYEQARAKIESGDTYMWLGGVSDIGKVPSGNQDVRYIAVTCLSEMRGMQQGGMGWTATFFAASSKVPEDAVRYMCFMYSEEGNKLAQWGIEGREWEWGSDGKPYFTDEMVERRAADYTGFTRETGFRLYYWGINYWDHYIEKAMMTKDPYLMSALELYGPYFGARMDYLSLRVDPETEEGIILQRCQDFYNTEFPQIIMCATDDDLVKKVESMKTEMLNMGIERVETVWTARSTRLKEIFKNGYTNGYPKWGDTVTEN